MSADSTASGSTSRSAIMNADLSSTGAARASSRYGRLVLGHDLNHPSNGGAAPQEVRLDLPDPAADLGRARALRPPSSAHAAICTASEPPRPLAR